MKRFKRILIVLLVFPVVVVVGLHVISEIIIHRVTQNVIDTDLFDVQTIHVNDIEWAFREYNAQGEETIVFVHGFMGSSFDFHLFNLDSAQALPHRILAVDLPGFA